MRQDNREARQQSERGVFDIDAVGEANRLRIETTEDSLRIADEGREARNKVCAELSSKEEQFRQSLTAAQDREQTTAFRMDSRGL